MLCSISIKVRIDYDGNKSTSTPGGSGEDYRIYISTYHPFTSWSRTIYGPSGLLEEGKIQFKWNDTSRIPIIIPGYAFQPGISRLASFVSIGLSEEVKEGRAVKLSEANGKWVRLAFDDYDGLPLDFHSLWVKWDGNRTLQVKAVYYQPMPIKRGDVEIMLPCHRLAIGYPGRKPEIKLVMYPGMESKIEAPPHPFILMPGGIWIWSPLDSRCYMCCTKCKVCKVRSNEMYYNLTLPKSPFPDMEIRASYLSLSLIHI